MIRETVELKEIAFARSGDKGRDANIALFAYTEEGYRFLKKSVDAKVVRRHFEALSPSNVIRFDVPNLHAFNFMLYDVLDPLRIDAQGKALGQELLQLFIKIPEEVLFRCQR